MTATIPTEAPTLVACAYRWMDRGDLDMARFYLMQLYDMDRAEARMNLVRLEALLWQLCAPSAEDVAKAALTPDALPDHVEGFPIAGLTRNQQHAERALAALCPYCGKPECLDDQRAQHERLDAGNEATWIRRART